MSAHVRPIASKAAGTPSDATAIGNEMTSDPRLLELIKAGIHEGLAFRKELGATQTDAIAAAAQLVVGSLAHGAKVLICGNGGSAADAQHIAAEMTGRFERPARRALRAIALTTDTSALTAIANDYGFEEVFARQVEAIGDPGDVLLALSTSGRSTSTVRAVAVARSMQMRTVAVTGPDPSELGAAADIVIAAPGTSAARIQELHITIGHLLCAAVDVAFDQ
jgi:D-sedoheptulose 7-phosphate isomerase